MDTMVGVFDIFKEMFSFKFVKPQEHEEYKRAVKERVDLFQVRISDEQSFIDLSEINARLDMVGKRSIMLDDMTTGKIEQMLVSLGREQIWHNKWLTDSLFINHYHSAYIEKIHVLDGVYEVTLYDEHGSLQKVVKLTSHDEEFVIDAGVKHNVFAKAGTKVITKFEKIDKHGQK